jgi:hypothetical protein
MHLTELAKSSETSDFAAFPPRFRRTSPSAYFDFESRRIGQSIVKGAFAEAVVRRGRVTCFAPRA